MGARIDLETQTKRQFDAGLQLLVRGSDPANADTGDVRVYAKAAGLYMIDDAGTVTAVGAGGGGGSGNLDGGDASSTYGGTTAIDGGSA